MNKVKTALLSFALLAPISAFATDYDPVAGVTSIQTNSSTLFNTIAPFVVGVVAFGILIGYAKMLKRK